MAIDGKPSTSTPGEVTKARSWIRSVVDLRLSSAETTKYRCRCCPGSNAGGRIVAPCRGITVPQRPLGFEGRLFVRHTGWPIAARRGYVSDRRPRKLLRGGNCACIPARASSHCSSSSGIGSLPASMDSIHESSHWSADARLIGVQRIRIRHSTKRAGDIHAPGRSNWLSYSGGIKHESGLWIARYYSGP